MINLKLLSQCTKEKMDMEKFAELNFLKKGKYLWSKTVVNKMLEELRNFQKAQPERCLTEFILEVEQANKKFLQSMKDIVLIMNCRAKGDNKSHFGGMECSKFMKDIVEACDKYLNSSQSINVQTEGTIGFVISQIKFQAKKDEIFAREFERETKENYISLGSDNSLEIFKKSGYEI